MPRNLVCANETRLLPPRLGVGVGTISFSHSAFSPAAALLRVRRAASLELVEAGWKIGGGPEGPVIRWFFVAREPGRRIVASLTAATPPLPDRGTLSRSEGKRASNRPSPAVHCCGTRRRAVVPRTAASEGAGVPCLQRVERRGASPAGPARWWRRARRRSPGGRVSNGLPKIGAGWKIVLIRTRRACAEPASGARRARPRSRMRSR